MNDTNKKLPDTEQEYIHSIAKLMHEEYEDYSQTVGWVTQKKCRTIFDELPQANKEVMLWVAKSVYDKIIKDFEPDENTSDGYHTFKELYAHRITLYIALCREIKKHWNGRIWRSKTHSDGGTYDGCFVLGIDKDKGGQITYHLPLGRWDETNFAETLEQAPEWDRHTPEDVLKRLKKL